MNAGRVVVDASVAVKWAVPTEALSEQARTLLQRAAQGELLLFGPPHLHGEVTNALLQRSRSREAARHLPADATQEGLAIFLSLPIEVENPPRLYEDSLALALERNLPSIYDSMYVVLARRLGAELWTADRRLLQVVGGDLPWVRSIAEYR